MFKLMQLLNHQLSICIGFDIICGIMTIVGGALSHLLVVSFQIFFFNQIGSIPRNNRLELSGQQEGNDLWLVVSIHFVVLFSSPPLTWTVIFSTM